MTKRMRRVALGILSTLAILVVSFGIAAPASAATYGPEKLVHSSGYCVESPTPYLGQQVILNYCGGPASHNQHFMFEDAGFVNVETHTQRHTFTLPSFDAYYGPYERGAGSTGQALASLSDQIRHAVREEVRRDLNDTGSSVEVEVELRIASGQRRSEERPTL